VDYLQLLRRPKRHESIHDAITQNMNTLANAAKHDNIAYVVLSQLSRTVERRNNKRPMLSDLRESGSIEERAKCVLGLYRGAYYGPPQPGIDYDDGSNGPEPSHDGDDGDGMPGTRPTDADWKQLIEIHVLKNSNGRTGYVRSRWHGATTRVH
jgi:replicative DNA helicase